MSVTFVNTIFKRMRALPLLVLTLLTAPLTAQTSPLPFFLDLRAGALLYDFDAGKGNSQTVFGAGYRINHRHGLGLSYHIERVSDAYGGNVDFRGVGLDWRITADNGFIVKLGGGWVTGNDSYWTEWERRTYLGGGGFVDLSLDYQLRTGITFGVYVSNVTGIRYDAYRLDVGADPGDFIYLGVREDETTNFGLSVGLAFPRRKRR